MAENLKLLFALYARPGWAMSSILDRGSLLFSSLAVLAVTLLLGTNGPQLGLSFYMPLLMLAVAYVPGVLLLSQWLAGAGSSVGAVFRRDYSTLLTCAGMAAAAAGIPLVVAHWISPLPVFLMLAGAAGAYFLLLMFFAVRTVFGAANGSAGAVALFSLVPLAAAPFVLAPLRFVMGWLASPFFLFYAYYYLGREIGGLGSGLRSRQSFRRMMEAAAVNPHDADAQTQLGIIYQQRRQYTEAVQRFNKALEIDPREIEAHFQLGRIAREQGKLREALTHFQVVVDLNEKHSQYEVLRELGAVYVTAGQFEDARNELASYLQHRPYDPEGSYCYGRALEGLGKRDAAREAYAQSVEAAATAPRYRQHLTAPWSRLSQKRMRGLK